MTEPEIATEPDRIPTAAIRIAIAIVAAAIAVSIVAVWLLAGRVAHGGGRGDIAAHRIEPPADPFDVATEHERVRAAQRALLDTWQWVDAAHTRVRMPLPAAIDHYLGGKR